MNGALSPSYVTLCLLGGGLLGWAYFFLLWLTARATPRVQRPAVLLVVSFLFRILVLLGGLYVLTRGNPVGIFAALLGVMVGRRVMTRSVLRRTPAERMGAHD